MGTWWRGTALVAERGIVENVRSRTFKVVTGLLLVLSAAAVILPQLLRSDETTYVLATTQPAAAGLAQALEAAGTVGGFTVSYDVRADDAAVRQAVRDGDATAGLVGDTLYTSMGSGTFPVLVAQSMVALEASERLLEAGLTPTQIAEVQSVQPPRQVDVGRVEDARAVVGFAVGIGLFLALTFAGNAIATTVAMEKSTRISEVLLAVLRPSQALVGTVAAVGAVTLVQLLVLVTPVAVAVQVMDDIELPPVAGGDLAIAVVWFVLGFALYAFLFAASASLVDKITEVSSAVLPVTLVLTASYLVAITVVAADPEGVWGVLASIFPFTAPIAMPIRWAGGQVPVAQLLLAMALTAATAVLLVWLASAIYRRALVITGRRVRVSEVFGTRTGRS